MVLVQESMYKGTEETNRVAFKVQDNNLPSRKAVEGQQLDSGPYCHHDIQVRILLWTMFIPAEEVCTSVTLPEAGSQGKDTCQMCITWVHSCPMVLVVGGPSGSWPPLFSAQSFLFTKIFTQGKPLDGTTS